MTDTATLDALIDDYLRHDAKQRPYLGFPRRSAFANKQVSNKTWDSADEVLGESVRAIEMDGMSGAWESLTVRQEQALRIDAENRRAGATVFRIAHLNEIATAAEVRAAKSVLRNLLVQRNVLC